MESAKITIALVGNPNAGKSTLFNALSGLRQHVGNYPGVTVERKTGSFRHETQQIEIIDLPGTYSLSARSPDEMVAVDLLLGRLPSEPAPDVILSIVDASNLDRHLFLTSQLYELNRPIVVALNMIDVAASQQIEINVEELSQRLGVPVIPVQANKGKGLAELKQALVAAARTAPPSPGPVMPDAFRAEVDQLATQLGEEIPRFLVSRLILDINGHVEKWLASTRGPEFRDNLAQLRQRLSESGCPVPAIEARTRYGWIRAITNETVKKPDVRPVTWTDRIDSVLTHKFWGTLFFLAVMFLMFQAIFIAAAPLMDAVTGLFDDLSEVASDTLGTGPFGSLVADGICKGVGGVLVFLPQILILFFFIAVLEDCGYMARAAFLMDRIMSRCGLSGKSFIPLLSSVACAVPGIMATRVIENWRDRFATIMVAPLMSCSARLPVYLLLTAAFLKEGYPVWFPGLVVFGMYMIGFTVAPMVAWLLRGTLLHGEKPVFVMELPAYKRPGVVAVLRKMLAAGWAFLLRAGTLILASMIVVWALLYFPATDPSGILYPDRVEAILEQAEDESLSDEQKEQLAEEELRLIAEWKENSWLGRAGQSMEPVFTPLGWDWKLGMAVLASFPAREVIVGTLGIIYAQGDIDPDDDAERERLGSTLREQWKDDPIRGVYTVPVALSVMVFFALCCQCVSTLAVIRRETQSWFWPIFTFIYMTVLAYIAALLVFQIGRWLIDMGVG